LPSNLTKFDWLVQQLTTLDDDLSAHWSAYPCLEWPWFRSPKGYGRLRGPEKIQQSHRAAFFHATGKLDPSKFVCHHCDNPPCFRPIHLFEGTVRDNTYDMIAKGRQRFKPPINSTGEKSPCAKYTEAQMIEVVRLARLGIGITKISAETGVAVTSAYDVLRGRNWKHLTADRPLSRYPVPLYIDAIARKERKLLRRQLRELQQHQLSKDPEI
jgi:hypothetical protein